MDLNGRNMKRILLIVIVAILVFVTVQNFEIVLAAAKWVAKLLSPFVVGLCFAFIFNVLLKYLEERCFQGVARRSPSFWKKNHRAICLSLTYLLIAGLICILVFLIVPQLKKSGTILVENLPGYLASLNAWADKWLSSWNFPSDAILSFTDNWDKTLENLLNLLNILGPNVVDSTVNVASGIISAVVSFIVGLVFSAYLLARKEALCLTCKRILFAFLPRDRAEYVTSVGKLTNKTFAGFVAGQLTEMVIIGILCFIGMSIFRMPYASLISTVVAATALIPIFGAFIGTAIGAFLLLMVNPMTALWFVVFIIILQQIESNLIYPKVVGTSVGLPGIWVLFAVMVGGNVFGVMGMLVGIPLASVGYTLFRDTVVRRLKARRVSREEIANAGREDFRE